VSNEACFILLYIQQTNFTFLSTLAELCKYWLSKQLLMFPLFTRKFAEMLKAFFQTV